MTREIAIIEREIARKWIFGSSKTLVPKGLNMKMTRKTSDKR